MFNETDLICKRLSSGDRTITEFNKINEVSGDFCWQSKKIGEKSCPTIKHATNGRAQDSANYFGIYFYKYLRLHVQTRVKTPLETHFLYLWNKKNTEFLRLAALSLYFPTTAFYFII